MASVGHDRTPRAAGRVPGGSDRHTAGGTNRHPGARPPDPMPTDESRIELPAWLPWATTACLAALVACLGELWVIERARSQLLREEGMLTEAALKGMQNQLEAERI